MPLNEDPGSKATRSKHACRKCNARRVRCDVMAVQPCSNCEKTGQRCELVPSKRGKYPRKARHQAQASISTSPGSPGDALNLSSPTEAAGTEGQPDPTPRSNPQGGEQRGGLFIGESNFFSLVAQQPPSREGMITDSNAGRDFSSLPPTSSPIAVTGSTGVAHLSAGVTRHLRDEGALTHLDMNKTLPALKSYFDWFHPCFPVVDRHQVAHQFASNSISNLLLSAMLFIGVTYCEEDVITDIGFKDRSEAKSRIYHRARLLFEADVEKDRIASLQSVFLLSFWRSTVVDIKDVRYWLGIAITLAESLGIHRSTRGTTRESKTARLRRRIWWSIYVRERQAAASLGLPCRIKEADCDVEPLSSADLESDPSDPETSIFGICELDHITYSIKMVEVATMLGQVVDSYFAPDRPPPSTEVAELLSNTLESSRQNLPETFLRTDDDGRASVWTCLLHLAFNYLRLLIYQGTLLRQDQVPDDNTAAIHAASQISRITEDMLMQGTMRYAQMHLITSLFAALCVHAINTHRVSGAAQAISKHRARVCVLGLKEVNKYWMVNVRMLDFFSEYLDDPSIQPPRAAYSSAQQHPSSSADLHPDDETAGADLSPEAWFHDQYFSMLYGPFGGDVALVNTENYGF